MLAYHNDPARKDFYLNRVRKHRAADEILQNYGYWEYGKGCAVGCTIHGGSYLDYQDQLQMPAILAGLKDRIFEDLPAKAERELQWPEAFLSAIRVGAPDAILMSVCLQFLAEMLDDPEHGVICFVSDRKTKTVMRKAAKAVRRVAVPYRRKHEGKKVTALQWNKAAHAAAAGRIAAAHAAADAADAAANDNFVVWQANRLLELLRAA